ncbi:hypothetical protein BsWGS_17356 [Bradybaena similaris]
MKPQAEKKGVRRPMNAFLIFCKLHRSSIRARNPSMDNRDVTRALGDLWANLADEKIVYIKMAQQQKDAFFEAHPGYKWHQNRLQKHKALKTPGKASCSKEVTDNVSDEFLDPAELAEPSINYPHHTLMAEKLSVASSSFPLLTTKAIDTISESPAVSPEMAKKHEPRIPLFSALLVVAERCRNELIYGEVNMPSRLVQPSPQLQSPLKGEPTLFHPITDFIHGCHPPKSPSKKCTWSLADAGNVLTMSSNSCYTDMETCMLASPEGMLPSTSESLSSLCLFQTATEDSPMFPQTSRESEQSVHKSDYCNETYITLSPLLASAPRTPALKHDPHKHQLQPHDPHKHQLQPHDPHNQLQSLPDGCSAGMPRKLFVYDNGTISAANSHFQRYVEPGMSDKRFGSICTENLAPEASPARAVNNESPDWKSDKPLFASPSPARAVNNESPDWKSDKPLFASPSPARAVNNESPDWKSDKPFFASPSPAHAVSHDSLDWKYDKPFFASPPPAHAVNHDSLDWKFDKPFFASPSPHTRTTLASSFGKSRLISLLGNNNATDCQASSDPEVYSRHKMLRRTGNTTHPLNKQSCRSKQADSCQQGQKLGLSDRRAGNLIMPEYSVLRPPLSQLRNVSKGKLKKKWEVRMLVETEQYCGDHCQSEVKHGQDATIVPPKQVHRQNMSLGSEHSPQCDSLKMHQKNEAPILAAGQKPILIQLLGSHGAVGSQVPSFPSCNSGRYSKLRHQLSQNLPDLPRLQFPFSAINMEQGQEAPDRSSSDQNHCSLSFGHQRCTVNPNKTTEATGKHKLAAEDPSDKNINHIAACGKQFTDHMLEHFFTADFSKDKKVMKTDICEDKQIVKECSGLKELVCEGNSAVVKPDCWQRRGSILAGLREGSVVRWQKENHVVEYNLMTASSLVEKVVREFCDSSQRKDTPSSPKKAKKVTQNDDRHVQTHEDLSSEGSKRGESSLQCQLPPATVGSINDAEITDETIIQPIRKSGRANRGQKYQELIKELIVQPSRERLVCRNGEKHRKNPG